MVLDRPTWIEVDTDAVASNMRMLRAIVRGGARILAIIKGDAYGHGATLLAKTVLGNGADMLGIACLSEGVALRRAGITAPIMNVGFTPVWQARDAVLSDLTTTVFSMDLAEALSQEAVKMRREARIHVKVDTGMGRLGLLPHQVRDFVRYAKKLPGVTVEGIFTHLATAGSPDRSGTPGWGREYTVAQLSRFQSVLKELERDGIEIPFVHAANSAAIFAYPEAHFNMVRPGIAIYGLNPSAEVTCPSGFKPALSFKTIVAQVKTLEAGSYVSYECTYRAERTTTIAVIPVGFGDGFRRGPVNWGQVLVCGHRAPVVGRVCMDLTMIDVTAIPGAKEGDEVVLLGRQGDETISVDEVASAMGTANSELVSAITSRVPRVPLPAR